MKKAQVRKRITFMGWKMVLGFVFVFYSEKVCVEGDEGYRWHLLCPLSSLWETFWQVPLNMIPGLLLWDK